MNNVVTIFSKNIEACSKKVIKYHKCVICDNSIKNKKKYNCHCYKCFKLLFPQKIVHNGRVKEDHIVKQIMGIYSNFSWVCNKKIQDGISKKRPDLLCDFGSHILIVEIDEHGHKNYKNIDEGNRMLDLLVDTGLRSIVCIRFNPDSYTKANGLRMGSCWSKNKGTGLLEVKKGKEDEWNSRMNKLMDEIGYWCKKRSENRIEVVKLFYNEKK